MEEERVARTITAVYYNSSTDTTALVPVTIGSQESIEQYLVGCDGKARTITLGQQDYWILVSGVNADFLLFRWDLIERFKSATEEDLTKAMFLSL